MVGMIGAFICFAVAVIGISVIINTALSSESTRRNRSRSDASWHIGKANDLPKNGKGERGKISRAELRLSTYLFYDEKQAKRLVDGVQARHPDMPREWCAEKALSDLERDRQTR